MMNKIIQSKMFEKREICKTFLENCKTPGDSQNLQNAIIDL